MSSSNGRTLLEEAWGLLMAAPIIEHDITDNGANCEVCKWQEKVSLFAEKKRNASETSGDVRVQNLLRALDAKQAKIDALMMEFCPGEMSKEQRDEWAKHQQPVSADVERSITESFARSPRRVESAEKSESPLTISKPPQ